MISAKESLDINLQHYYLDPRDSLCGTKKETLKLTNERPVYTVIDQW